MLSAEQKKYNTLFYMKFVSRQRPGTPYAK